MVKKTFFIALSAFFLTLISAEFLIAGEFTASVSSTQVDLNENFSLILNLKDASPKEAPVLSILKKNFLIHSQQQAMNTSKVNGKVSLNIVWKLSLTSKVEGNVEIPPIAVDTTEGLLFTQPISLRVLKGSSSSRTSSVDNGLNITAKVSNSSPYKNEPLLYTAFLSSKLPLYHVQTQKMQVDDAIVELQGEPKIEERAIDGVLFQVLEFTYLITPLKTGTLTIPSIAVQGAIPQKRKGGSSSFFNDYLDPFSLMQRVESLTPFTLMTEEIALDIQPALPEVSPWLPAKDFSLQEVWSSDQTFQVGEPFSRGFLMKAEGVKVSQLPRLEGLQGDSSNFKVYADKPEEQEKMQQGVIHSSRKEHYTLIPQQSGTQVLPEISISWWDSINKEKRISTIPARTVQILPSLETTSSSHDEIAFAQDTSSVPREIPTASTDLYLIFYGIIGILIFFLMAALFWGFTLQRKIASLTQDPSQKAVKQNKPTAPKVQKPIPPSVTVIQRERKEKLPDLNPT